MYYRLKYGKYYLIKIIILVLSAVLDELIIWWALIREESVEWIMGQVIYNPSPYAIIQLEDERMIVGNVLDGFEIILPPGWEAEEKKVPDFFKVDRQSLCEIKGRVKKEVGKVSVDKLPGGQSGFAKTYADITPAIKKRKYQKPENLFMKCRFQLAVLLLTMSCPPKKKIKTNAGHILSR